jgi:membrane associated rhomboid family serine protease
MPSGADLFVVCKHCGSEVSPYITECPYCGHRLRRRAPKLPREGETAPKLGGLRSRWGAPGSTPKPSPARPRARRALPSFAAMDATRPYATIAIVAAGALLWVLLRAGYFSASKLAVAGPLHGDWWKLFTTQFAYIAGGLYAFVALLVVAIFGWLLERRLGAVFVLVLFLGAGAAGALVALAVYPFPAVLGANAGALALLAAWAAPDLRAARSGEYYEGDLLGAGALAALLLAMPFVLRLPEASWLAGVTGGVVGLLVGAGLQRGERASR